MTVSRSLAWRFVLACLLAAIVGVAGTIWQMSLGTQTAIETFASDVASGIAALDDGQVCASMPPLVTPSGAHFGFIDPSEPSHWERMPEAIRDSVNNPGDFVFDVDPEDPRPGVAFAIRRAATGPCAVFFGTWPALRGIRPRMVISSAITSIGAAILAGILGFFAFTSPLLRRLRNVGQAALLMGQGERPLQTHDRRGDEVSLVASAIEAADKRIRADRATILKRQAALERHLAQISHDLKTPLTSVFMSLESALSDFAAHPDLPKSAGESVGQALVDTVYLAALAENHYLGRRFAEGLDLPANAMERLDLNDILLRVVRRHRVVAKQRGLRVDAAYPDDPICFNGNSVMLERAFSNLAQNAVFYAGRGAQVTLVLQTRGANGWSLDVLDDGPGVPAEELPRLVERRYRGSNARARGEVSQGLGLAIVAEVCALHNLHLSFEPNEPHGLIAHIRTPDTEVTQP